MSTFVQSVELLKGWQNVTVPYPKIITIRDFRIFVLYNEAIIYEKWQYDWQL